jgi:hypothetical protein
MSDKAFWFYAVVGACILTYVGLVYLHPLVFIALLALAQVPLLMEKKVRV